MAGLRVGVANCRVSLSGDSPAGSRGALAAGVRRSGLHGDHLGGRLAGHLADRLADYLDGHLVDRAMLDGRLTTHPSFGTADRGTNRDLQEGL
jgi:hypothetical protein